MTAYYVVLLNFKGSTPVDRIKTVFNNFKDWLLFSPDGWIVFTGLTPTEIRERLKSEFASESPSIIVVSTDMSGWSTFSTDVSRNWLKKLRDETIAGE